MSEGNMNIDAFNLLPWRVRLDRVRTAWFVVLWAGTMILALMLQAVWFVHSTGQMAIWSARDWADQLHEQASIHRSWQQTVEDQAPVFDHHQTQIDLHHQINQALTQVATMNARSKDRLSAWIDARPAGVWIDALQEIHRWPGPEDTEPEYATVLVKGHAMAEAMVDQFWQQWQATIPNDVVVQGEVAVAPANDEGLYPFLITVELGP